MSELTEKMHVMALGDLTPADIGGEVCEDCPNNKSCGEKVLLRGVTKQAATLLFEDCEIVPVGTLKRIEELEAQISNINQNRIYTCNCQTPMYKSAPEMYKFIHELTTLQGQLMIANGKKYMPKIVEEARELLKKARVEK